MRFDALVTLPMIGMMQAMWIVSFHEIFVTGLSMRSPVPEVYPVSRRTLIERAKAIDPSLAKGSSKGSYSAVGWSNRVGTVLTPVAEGVYTADRPFLWNNIDVGCRMTVIEMKADKNKGNQQKSDLFVHSPVSLDQPLVRALEQLGTVKHVVSPNYEHVKFAKSWGEYYPEANMWACPGMMERESQVRWTGEIPYGIRPASFEGQTTNNEKELPPMFWDVDEIQPMHVDCEVNPFTGKPFFNEVVFFHQPTKTLLATDTYWNYPRGDSLTNANYLAKLTSQATSSSDDSTSDFGVWELAPDVGQVPLGSQVWKIGMDKLFRPFYLNLMVKNDRQGDFRSIVSHIINKWSPQTVIPAHGDTIRGTGFIRAVLTEHFGCDM